MNAFEVMKKAARPCHNRFKSQFQLSNVIKFQQGYSVTSNKEVYLGEYRKTKDKPYIFDLIEAGLVDFPAMNNIGFESKKKEKATKALAVSVRMFHFMHADRKALSNNERSEFNTPILSGIKHAIVAKAKPPLKRNLKRSILKLR